MGGIVFDFSVNLGNLLTILSFIVGGIAFIMVMRGKIDLISKETADLKTGTALMQQELKKLTDVLIVQGRQDERITAMDQRMVNQGKRIDDTVRRINTFLDMRSVQAVDGDE